MRVALLRALHRHLPRSDTDPDRDWGAVVTGCWSYRGPSRPAHVWAAWQPLQCLQGGEEPAAAWQVVETRHLRWPEGPHPEQRMWECTVLPVPGQKGLGRGKDKTWKNVKCGDSMPAV